ncbi:MAG: hypothetical protein JWO42_2858, partial [Chloroflexi bacterium]|nr:hypothetical protein [Chloroflexota bacterium]
MMDVSEDRPFGALLRAHRVGAGLSQEELAERSQLSQRTISDLERGVTTAPYRDTIVLLADALALVESDRTALEESVHRARASSTTVREPDGSPVDPLLITKLAIPSARGALVPRRRLMERLHLGLQGPLTVLSAPAGSCKTTLLSAWRASSEGSELPLGWVSLDETDNDPTRFWRYVFTALDRAAPGVGAAALARLRHAEAGSMEAVLGALVNALAAYEGDIVLVLDDYHVIDAEPIHWMLAFLVEHLPPSLHLVLATRADPPMPLARLRAKGEVTELRARDLRFSVEETTAFLDTVMRLSLSPDEVAALETRTEGWIAGLQLAGLSLQGRSSDEATAFVAAFTGSHRYIVDYLLDEVLLRQPEHVQRFLLHTCILERLSAPLCAAVLEGDDPPAERIGASQKVLEGLERNNVFLIAMDDERRWYRYHYLFADAMRQRQTGNLTIPDAAVLHRRAGTWFERQGLLNLAIGHALAGGWHDKAAELIKQAAPALLARGEAGTIGTWLRALPDTTMRAQPQLAILYAWLLIDMRDHSGVERYLQYAQVALEDHNPLDQDEFTAHLLFRSDLQQEGIPSEEPGDTGNIRAMIWSARSIVSAIHGDASQAIPQAHAALDALDATDMRSRSLAMIGLGLAHLSQGAVSRAAETFREVAVANQGPIYRLIVVLAAVGEACALRLAGALGQARGTYERAIEWSSTLAQPSLLEGSLYTGLADIL